MAEADGTSTVELTMGDRLNLITLAVPPEGGLPDGAGHIVGATVLSAVLMQLGLHADGHGMAFPSVRKVAARIGAGTRTVDRALAAMEAAGMLERRWRRRGACGTWGPTVWRLRWGRIAGLVPAADRFRLPQGIVVVEIEAHEPCAPGARGEEGHHAPPEGATMRPQGAEPCAPRGARTLREPSENQQQVGREADAGGEGSAAAAAGGPGDGGHGGGGKRPGRNGTAVEAMARQLEAWGVGEPTRTLLANQCGDGLLPMAEARKVHRRWWDSGGRTGRKHVGVLVCELRDLAARQAAARRIEREWGSMSPSEQRSAVLHGVVGYVRSAIEKRRMAGLDTDQRVARQCAEYRMAEASGRLGLETWEEAEALWAEVWGRVESGAETRAEAV